MIERSVMNSAMHMGPINRDLKPGDVVAWDSEQDTLAINGSELRDDGRKRGSTEGFAEAARILRVQREKTPDSPWSDQLASAKSEPSSTRAATDTLAVFPLLGCFKAVEDWLKGEQAWAPVTELQTQFLEHFIAHMGEVDALGDNLRRRADSDVEVINSWLRENNFQIQLKPLPGKRDFYVASILDVLVEWLKEGDKASIQYAGKEYDAVRLKEGVAAFHNPELHPEPIAKIRTKSGDLLCMSVVGRLPEDKFAIHWKVQQLQAIQKPYPVEGVVFPMVKYDQEIDISWLKGLRTNSGEEYWEVAEALQQTRFRMNEFGARAESAAAISMLFKCASMARNPWLVIDKPFLLWIEREGVAMPLFAGTFAQDVWENPGNLD